MVLRLGARSASGSGDVMDWELSTFFSIFGLGASGGFILYVIFSLMGYGIYSILKIVRKGD